MNFMMTAYSDAGVKAGSNQDSVLVRAADTEDGQAVLAVVCDGVGGLAKGELASAVLVRAFSQWFQRALPTILYRRSFPGELRSGWEALLSDANARLLRYGDRQYTRLGTTVTALLLARGSYYVINVGDSRVYMLDRHIHRLTQDHTLVQQEVDMGRLTYEESLRDSRRNILLQCVGASDRVEPDFYSGRIPENAVFVLCSDGFRHMVTEKEIYQYMRPQILLTEEAMCEAASYLVELNKRRLETDDISVAVVRAFGEGA